MIKYRFLRSNSQIPNISFETPKAMKSRNHSLGSKEKVLVTNINTSNCSNVLYMANSMSIFTMVFHFLPYEDNLLSTEMQPWVHFCIWSTSTKVYKNL